MKKLIPFFFILVIFSFGIFASNNIRIDNLGTTNYLFPQTDGTANQIITTNGAGLLSWTDLNTDINLISTNYWTKYGTDLIYTGDVRIGDVASTHPFAVTDSAYAKPLFEVRDNGNLYFGGGGSPKRIMGGPSWAGDNVYIGFYESSGFYFKAYTSSHTSSFNHNVDITGALSVGTNLTFGGDFQMTAGKRIYSGYQNSLYLYGPSSSGTTLVLGHTNGLSNFNICNGSLQCYTSFSADGRVAFGGNQAINGNDNYRVRITPYTDGNTNIDLWSINKTISSGTYMSGLGFYGNDLGYNYNGFGAKIEAYGDGSWRSTTRATKLVFKTATQGETTLTEKMVIKNDGNVGIGTSTPSEKLDVNGNIHISELEGTYTGGSAYVCVYDSGVLFASDEPCP